jgi:hypothetical protein
MEGDLITLSDIFVFEGEITVEGSNGTLRPTGVRPKLAERLLDFGIVLPAEMFGAPAERNGSAA